MFKVFVNQIIKGQTAVKYLEESDDLDCSEAQALLRHDELVKKYKAKGGVEFGFGDCVEIVLESGHRGSPNDPTLCGFWLVEMKVAHELINY